MKTMYVAVQKVWVQVSADYASAENTRTLVVRPETTVEEIIKWGTSGALLGMGDIVICVACQAVHEEQR